MKCEQKFYGDLCLAKHVARCKRTTSARKCIGCKREFPLSRNDENGTVGRTCASCIVCPVCFCFYAEKDKDTHHCFMYKPHIAEPVSYDDAVQKFWAFDFESMFIPGVETIGGVEVAIDQHVVNFVACRQLGTGVERQFSTIDEFVAFLLTFTDKTTFVAHNMKGYDGRLLIDYCLHKNLLTSKDAPLKRGDKIMKMKLGKVTFIDSLCHVATSLAKMPKIFGLDESQYRKGFFPYKFNTAANQSYVGAIPPLRYFDPDLMGENKRAEVYKWWQEQKDVPYDFRHELEAYCLSDVRILAQAMEVYVRDGMAQNDGLNPLDCTTIASYAMKIYASTYLPDETVARLTPDIEAFVREGFFGGRTDVRQMLKEWSMDDVRRGVYGVYQDVQSLYPTVQFYDAMPIGHPTIMKYQDYDDMPSPEYLETFFGFARVDLTPTRYIHHPVIVERKDGKLIADLLPKKRVRPCV